MTEKKWLAAVDPAPVLKFLRGKASDRKLRLLICGCSGLIADSMTAPQLRQAVDVSARFADGNATVVERAAAARALMEWDEWEGDSLAKESAYGCARGAVWSDVASAVGAALDEVASAFAYQSVGRLGPKWGKKQDAAKVQVTSFVRDIFGNPFRPVPIDPRWRTETVVALASSIYAEPAFDRLPILADALEDAG